MKIDEVRTVACKGIEFRLGACEIWTLADGVQASVFSPGRTCMQYVPFRTLDGFNDRVCRGSNSTDSSSSYYFLKPPDVTPTLEACQSLCRSTAGCKGIEFRSGWCEIWTRPAGIAAVAPSSGAYCFRYEPFVEVDGGVDRECRGSNPNDNWDSYYTLTLSISPSECKDLCLTTWNCKGIEYDSGRCEVWQRSGGIGATAPKPGAICLRLGPMLTTTDSFTTIHGSEGRACRGSDEDDDDPSYYELVGPARARTLEECKILCVSRADCRGIDFSSTGCKVWTKEDGIQWTSSLPGSTCLIYEPFQGVDGGEGRECRGSHASDVTEQYYLTHSEASLQKCKDRCASTAGCKGVSFKESICQVWMVGIHASASLVGSQCFRFEPFIDANGGQDQSCRGSHIFDSSAAYYQSFTRQQVPTLEDCKAECVGTVGCRGIEFKTALHESESCRVWTKAEGIGTTVERSGSLCIRFGSPDPLRSASAFHAVDGGSHRACRGANESDNSESNWIFFSISEVRTLEACELHCMSTPGCAGIEFSRWGCEVWTELIEASVYAAEYECFRFQPFLSADGFEPRSQNLEYKCIGWRPAAAMPVRGCWGLFRQTDCDWGFWMLFDCPPNVH